jgi:hypothetical protein
MHIDVFGIRRRTRRGMMPTIAQLIMMTQLKSVGDSVERMYEELSEGTYISVFEDWIRA